MRRHAFTSENDSLISQPAFWTGVASYAAVPAASAVTWSQRRRFVPRRVAMSIASVCLTVVCSVSATLRQELPGIDDLDGWAMFSLGHGKSIDRLSGFVRVQGDIAIARAGSFSIRGSAIVDGDLYYHSNDVLRMSGDAAVTGTSFDNQDSELNFIAQEAIDVSDRAFALQPTQSRANIILSRHRNLTISGAPGETVVLFLKNFMMSGSSSFTLQGTATTSFVINVTEQFSLAGASRILLSGGLQWNNVLFNVRGRDSAVKLSGDSSFMGLLVATRRAVKMSGDSTLTGGVIARKMIISGAASIIDPPVISP